MSNRQFLINVFRPNFRSVRRIWRKMTALLLGDIIFKNSLKKPENKAFSGFFIRTGDERIELPPKVLETPIIPVDQSPTFRMSMIPQNFIHNK